MTESIRPISSEKESAATVPHKAEPHPWGSYVLVEADAWEGNTWARERPRGCRFCGGAIQRRGILRRWAHVT